MANRNECFSDFKKKNRHGKTWHSASRMGDREGYIEKPIPLARSYADVITKFFRLDGLPTLLTHGALLARLARLSSAIKNVIIRGGHRACLNSTMLTNMVI